MMRIVRTLVAGWTCIGLAGCAGFWDEVTSRDFSVTALVNPPDPMTVLRTSQDGDARAKAFRRLEEPHKRGGNPAEQDETMQLLSRAAVTEPQPLCRMAAIQALGRCQDPRAVPALTSAYEAADQLTPDLAFMVRCQALNALGQTKQPEAATFLADIARRPVGKDLSERERGQVRDVRLAAVRSLGNFPGSPPAAELAKQLATQEKDIAVRDRAREVHVAVTGKEFDATVPGSPAAPSPIQAVGYQDGQR